MWISIKHSVPVIRDENVAIAQGIRDGQGGGIRLAR